MKEAAAPGAGSGLEGTSEREPREAAVALARKERHGWSMPALLDDFTSPRAGAAYTKKQAAIVRSVPRNCR